MSTKSSKELPFEYFFGMIMERVALISKSKNDSAICRALRTGSSSMTTWRKREKIPYDFLVPFAEEYQVSLDWLIWGRGKSRIHPEFEQRLESLNDATDMVIRTIEERTEQPDLMQLAPLRDMAYSLNMNDDQIKQILILMESAPKIYGYSKPLDIKLLEISIELAYYYIQVSEVELNHNQTAQVITGIYERHKKLIEASNGSPNVVADKEQESAEIINLIDHIRENENGDVAV